MRNDLTFKINSLVREAETLHYHLVTRSMKGDAKAKRLIRKARSRYNRRKQIRQMAKQIVLTQERKLGQLIPQ